jgi:hypothetical protein
MTRTLFAAALAAALLASPAFAKCHGHFTADGEWYLDVNSWSYSEMLAVDDLFNEVKKILPDTKDTSASIAAIVDQYACSGVSFEGAKHDILGMAASMAALKADPHWLEKKLDGLK